MATFLDVVTAAFREIGVQDAVDPLPPEMAEQGRMILSRILDSWNADVEPVYADRFSTFTITPSLSPHTIGPSGATWTIDQRPVEIRAASVIVDGVRIALHMRDGDWWQSEPLPGLTSTYPTDLYFNPTYPNGSVYLWPVPTTAYQVQLQTWGVLTSTIALADTFAFPQGYLDALTQTLKEELVSIPTYSSSASVEIFEKARKARARIFGARRPDRRISVADGVWAGPGFFDWRTGVMRSAR